MIRSVMVFTAVSRQYTLLFCVCIDHKRQLPHHDVSPLRWDYPEPKTFEQQHIGSQRMIGWSPSSIQSLSQ